MARNALDASQWRDAGETVWRAAWDAEAAALPSHKESRFWLVTGLLLPIWDRLPTDNMRVYRLATDEGEAMIGRVLGPAEVESFHAALGLAGGPCLTPDELCGEILGRGASFPLANGWRLARRRLAGADRIEIEGPADRDIEALKHIGCVSEIVAWRARVFAPGPQALERLIGRWPLSQAT